MNREELSQMVELLRDTAKLHQPNEEILTDVKAESFVFIMESVLSALSVPAEKKGTDLEEIVKEIKRERAYRENLNDTEEVCEVDVILRIIEPYMRGGKE